MPRSTTTTMAGRSFWRGGRGSRGTGREDGGGSRRASCEQRGHRREDQRQAAADPACLRNPCACGPARYTTNIEHLGGPPAGSRPAPSDSGRGVPAAPNFLRATVPAAYRCCVLHRLRRVGCPTPETATPFGRTMTRCLLRTGLCGARLRRADACVASSPLALAQSEFLDLPSRRLGERAELD